MNKTLLMVLAVLGVSLLIGSFWIRNVYGTVMCDVARTIGFICIFLSSIIRYRQNAK